MANKKQLPDGMGMPYVSVFDGVQNKPIIDPLSGLPIGMLVTQFEYIFDEEKGNTCEITIEVDNPNIIDLPTLKHKMPLKFQWGYIYPNGGSKSCPAKKMVIDDIEGIWSETGIKYTFKCSSPALVLKNMKAQLKEGVWSDYIENAIGGKFAIQVWQTEYGQTTKDTNTKNSAQRNESRQRSK